MVPEGLSFPPPAGFRLVSADLFRPGDAPPVRVVHPDPGFRLVLAPTAPVLAGWYQFELRFPAEGLVDVLVQFSFSNDRVLWLRFPLIARNHFLAHFRLEQDLQHLTLIVTGSGRLAEPDRCRFERVGLGSQLAAAVSRGIEIFGRDGFGVFASGLNYLWRLTRPGSIAISRGSASAVSEQPYETWIRIFDEAPQRDRARHEERLASLPRRPRISILIDVSSADEAALDHVARGLTEQVYPQWELVLAAPASLHNEIGASLASRGLEPGKLRLVNTGATAAGTLNILLAAAQGEYVLLLMPGGWLRPHALLDLALTVDRVPSPELVYWDEDCIDDAAQRTGWHFKPAWSPSLLQVSNYLGPQVLMRRETIGALGEREAARDSHHHDLVLRLTEQVEPRAIVHLAKLLTHVPVDNPDPPSVRVAPKKQASVREPRVSLIIPTRDQADVLETCIRSIRTRTAYKNYEILIVDNGSVEDRTKQLFTELGSNSSICVLSRTEPFNFSKLNNFAAREAAGEILGLVNNDVEVTKEDWLDQMVALAARPQTGCVGAKLLYPDGSIQHAGIVIGLGGVAGHVHRFARRDDPGYLNRLNHIQEVSAVTAACLLVRKQVFQQVGGLDESLTVAFNDVDFCLRVRSAGYLNLWTPFAELIHHESVSRGRDFTPSKARRFAEEYGTMQSRWGAALMNDPYYSPHLTYDREDSSLRLR